MCYRVCIIGYVSGCVSGCIREGIRVYIRRAMHLLSVANLTPMGGGSFMRFSSSIPSTGVMALTWVEAWERGRGGETWVVRGGDGERGGNSGVWG